MLHDFISVYSRFPAICIVSHPDNDCIFTDRSLGQNHLKNHFLPDAFYGLATENVNHPHLQAITTFHVSSHLNFLPVLWDFGSSADPVSGF